MNRLHMMPVLSLNVGVSGVKPSNRRLHAELTTDNHLLPQKKSWAGNKVFLPL
jgi:hypothetical protein